MSQTGVKGKACASSWAVEQRAEPRSHRVTEYAVLEGTYRDYQIQPLAPYGTTENPNPSIP